MSYETHITMSINYIATSFYIYAVFELITMCLTMIINAAKSVPPTDFLSVLFNIWFSVVTLCTIIIMRPLIYSLLSPSSSKEKPVQPVCTFAADNKCQLFTMYENSPQATQLGAFFVNAIQSSPPKPEALDNTQTTQSPKSPGTPNLQAEERSQADTEPYTQGEIKPCMD